MKVYLVQENGIFDHELFSEEWLFDTKEKALEKLAERVRFTKQDIENNYEEEDIITHDIYSGNDYNSYGGQYVIEYDNEEEFVGFKDGYSVDDSIHIHIIELEVK